jgi:hypothetical protein
MVRIQWRTVEKNEPSKRKEVENGKETMCSLNGHGLPFTAS